MALTTAEEAELRALLTERAAARESKRLFDLEHKRMRLGRGGLTASENNDLDAHLSERRLEAGGRGT